MNITEALADSLREYSLSSCRSPRVSLDWRLETVCKDSYLFQDVALQSSPLNMPLPLTTHHCSSHIIIHGCREPWLNSQLLISPHSCWLRSSWSSKTRNCPRGKSSIKQQAQFSVPFSSGANFFSHSPMRLPRAKLSFWALNCSAAEGILLELACWLKHRL